MHSLFPYGAAHSPSCEGLHLFLTVSSSIDSTAASLSYEATTSLAHGAAYGLPIIQQPHSRMEHYLRSSTERKGLLATGADGAVNLARLRSGNLACRQCSYHAH